MKSKLELANIAYGQLVTARASGSYMDIITAYDAWRATLSLLTRDEQDEHLQHIGRVDNGMGNA
jgi:hypothetical protein